MNKITGANRRFSKALRGLATAGVVTITAVAALTASAHAQEQLTLKVGSEGAYPPYNFVKADGTVAGFEIDIANALCEELKAKCQIIVQEISHFEQCDIDYILTCLPLKKRQSTLMFTMKLIFI